MRGVGVPLALLVTPISTCCCRKSPPAHLSRMRDAFRLIDRTVALTWRSPPSPVADFAILFRHSVIGIPLPRRQFTAESTQLCGAVFLGWPPAWWGLEFDEVCPLAIRLERPWPPVLAAIVPVLLNVAITLRLHSFRPNGSASAPASA